MIDMRISLSFTSEGIHINPPPINPITTLVLLTVGGGVLGDLVSHFPNLP